MVCTFFGHKDCYGLKTETLLNAIEDLIQNGVDTFYVGHQGNFDSMVHSCLKQLKEKHPHISYSVVRAYLPTYTQEYDPYQGCSVFPEGLETVHPKFAIEKRNKWLIDHADYCVCCINHTWGGAYKFAWQAKRRGAQYNQPRQCRAIKLASYIPIGVHEAFFMIWRLLLVYLLRHRAKQTFLSAVVHQSDGVSYNSASVAIVSE